MNWSKAALAVPVPLWRPVFTAPARHSALPCTWVTRQRLLLPFHHSRKYLECAWCWVDAKGTVAAEEGSPGTLEASFLPWTLK